VQKVLGNASSALRSLEAAYDTFSRAGYAYRTALCGNALFELTKEQSWLDIARKNASHYPLSALASTASVSPDSRSTIHFSTRLFSPKPGHT
jgi:predicted S18 family serine protease